jgi:hypothetical protein
LVGPGTAPLQGESRGPIAARRGVSISHPRLPAVLLVRPALGSRAVKDGDPAYLQYINQLNIM